MKKTAAVIVSMMFSISSTFAAKITTNVYSTDDEQQMVGEVVFEDSPYGLLIIPELKNLPAGMHGFHLHQHASCDNHGKAAGGHFDPKKTNTHQGPYGQGHLGDLPVLYVTEDGKAKTALLAPRLKTSDLPGHTIMIHSGGDTYSDTPELGGGGARIACGVIKK